MNCNYGLNQEETDEEEDEQVAAANVQPLNVAEKTHFGVSYHF